MSARTRSVVVVVLASVLLGGITSYAQTVLPDWVASFANSASGWTVLTALVVAGVRPGLRLGAALGAASFVCLLLGYTVVAELRGFPYDPLFWTVVGIVAGPFVGAAAASLRGPDLRAAALGSGLLGGILLAEGIYGLTVVADSTSPVYWTLSIIGGAVLIVVVAARRLRSTRPVLLQGAATLAVLALASIGYAALNAVRPLVG